MSDKHLTNDSGNVSPAAIVAETKREIAALTEWIARVISAPEGAAAAVSQEVATVAAAIALTTVLPTAVQLNAYFAATSAQLVELSPPLTLDFIARAFVFRRPNLSLLLTPREDKRSGHSL